MCRLCLHNKINPQKKSEVLPILTQRKTQTAAYWQKQFTVGKKDIEFLLNHILENIRLFTLDELAIVLVKQHCEAEEAATRKELQRGELYQPKKSYNAGDRLVFPALEFALGTVISTRTGYHPEYGNFSVLCAKIEGEEIPREFVANFDAPNVMNIGNEESLASMQGLQTPAELFKASRATIRAKIKAALNSHDEFVEFYEQYFLRDLVTEFHEGLFNIADAAIDISQMPRSTDQLIQEMGLDKDQGITDVLRFSVNYRLDKDSRFHDVGPKGEVRWYLERMKPPEAHQLPARLQANGQTYEAETFDDEILEIIANIDDETSNPEDIAPIDPDEKQTTLSLIYPHWRVGSLPLTPKTETFFPISYHNPVMFNFIDGRTGDTFPGWTVFNHGYIFGLKEWYKKNNLPVGAYITLERTDDPAKIIIDYQATRSQRDWIREVQIVGYRLTFQMNPQAINCKYDDLMIISNSNPEAVDKLWIEAEDRNLSLYNILCSLFPELSKLNPQSTVHFKTLYSAVNILRRFSPGLVFAELNKHECFTPMNHGYWTFDSRLVEK